MESYEREKNPPSSTKYKKYSQNTIFWIYLYKIVVTRPAGYDFFKSRMLLVHPQKHGSQ